MRIITIEIDDHTSGGYTVREGDRSCPSLCWDEMLGSIAELTHPKIGQCRYRMLTHAEHEGERLRRELRMAEIAAGKE